MKKEKKTQINTWFLPVVIAITAIFFFIYCVREEKNHTKDKNSVTNETVTPKNPVYKITETPQNSPSPTITPSENLHTVIIMQNFLGSTEPSQIFTSMTIKDKETIGDILVTGDGVYKNHEVANIVLHSKDQSILTFAEENIIYAHPVTEDETWVYLYSPEEKKEEPGSYRVTVIVYESNNTHTVYDETIESGDLFPGWESSDAFPAQEPVLIPCCIINSSTKEEMKEYCYTVNEWVDETGITRLDFVIWLDSDEDSNKGSEVKENPDKNVIFENVPYGDNVVCTLYRDGTLVFTGTGAIWDYEIYETKGNIPYSREQNLHALVKKVIFHEGITKIGNYACLALYNCKEIVFPESLTEIGTGAFQEVGKESTDYDAATFTGERVKTNLGSSNVITLNEIAFRWCPLEEIVLPDTLQYKYAGVFHEARDVSENVTTEELSITIPSSVKVWATTTSDKIIGETAEVFTNYYIKGKTSVDEFEYFSEEEKDTLWSADILMTMDKGEIAKNLNGSTKHKITAGELLEYNTRLVYFIK